MKDCYELTTLMERVIHKYVQWENKKRTYGTNILLSRAEIHTVVVIGDNPNINITVLAEMLGITKGAASQMIYKLVDKGIIEKKVSPNSDTEVALNLTSDGTINYEAHRQYHRITNDKALNLLKGIPDPFYDYLIEYFSAFEQVIDEELKEHAG